MPRLNVENYGSFAVPAGKRLVLALEDEAGVDQMYLCGGKAICTTCVVSFADGEPKQMTEAEQQKLEEKDLTGVRLSCQITCQEDMSVKILKRVQDDPTKSEPGPRPADEIVPDPVWLPAS